MVKDFADNAHSLALDKLLSAKPQPGKRAEEAAVREKHIRGISYLWNLALYFPHFLRGAIQTETCRGKRRLAV